jgi:hypothetical protein
MFIGKRRRQKMDKAAEEKLDALIVNAEKKVLAMTDIHIKPCTDLLWGMSTGNKIFFKVMSDRASQDGPLGSAIHAILANFSHKSLQGKKTPELHDMLFGIGKNWNDLPPVWKNGIVIKKGEVSHLFNPLETIWKTSIEEFLYFKEAV